MNRRKIFEGLMSEKLNGIKVVRSESQKGNKVKRRKEVKGKKTKTRSLFHFSIELF